MKQKRLMVMAGGTGGHVFPALAVAHRLIELGWQVRWLGTSDRMEANLVPKHNIEIDFISISGVKGKGVKALLMSPFRIIRATLQARKILKKYNPDIVLGMGGYVSGPGGLAAWLCGIPVILHEQNGVAGLTNKGLSYIATRVLQAFPGAFKKADIVGNPVRTDVLAIPEPEQRFADRHGQIHLLVIGGSQGAQILNQTLPAVIAQLGDQVTVWHQVGKGALAQVEESYKKFNISNYKLTEFIDDIATAYQWADLVICRSGALTVSELSAAGLAAIFIPFMHKDRQQYWNAYPVAQAGAAIIIEQPNLTVDGLVKTIKQLDRIKLADMATKARANAITNATEKVASVIIDISEKKERAK